MPKLCVPRGVLCRQSGGFFANKTVKLSILSSFYISIFISSSAHVALCRVGAFLFLLTVIKL
uniref:Uncharacterized protein n=1 Tax=Siphoviridae sp. ctQqU1 TaxID=2825496 RepID=A0A8S5Q4H7_9CAUD|nr:MAG TPA: hypothetical protein [Siphoviridae sp. ctQqU1]